MSTTYRLLNIIKHYQSTPHTDIVNKQTFVWPPAQKKKTSNLTVMLSPV